jgi:NAD+ synthetase
MKVAVAQINPKIADVEGNAQKILDYVQRAKVEGAQLVIFPELSLTGSPLGNLLEKDDFIQETLKVLDELAKKIEGITAVVGYPDRNISGGRPLYNTVAVIEDGSIASVYYKTIVSLYEPYQFFYFEHALSNIPYEMGKQKIAFTIGEDLMFDYFSNTFGLYKTNPIEGFRKRKTSFLVNSCASPYFLGEDENRIKIAKEAATRLKVPVIVCNQVGGNDEFVFDGNSFCIEQNGRIVARAKAFEEDMILIDTETLQGDLHYQELTDVEKIYKALVLGTRDYVRKCGFSKGLVGVSGGIDSAAVLCIAVNALGKENVLAVFMPSEFTAEQNLKDVQELIQNLGVELKVLPINPLFDSYKSYFAQSYPDLQFSVAEENIQARIRSNILMWLSNRFDYMVLATGNRSESLVGYYTLYGDSCGGLRVIGDIPKTFLYRIVREVINKERQIIPQTIIDKVPSAELKPGQRDTDDVGEYGVLDPVLEAIHDKNEPLEKILQKFDKNFVLNTLKKMYASEFKGRQTPLRLNVYSPAYMVFKRYPISGAK